MFLFQALSCKTYVKQMFYCLADPKSIHPILGSLCSDCSVISSPFNLIYSFIVIWRICSICILGNAWKGVARCITLWLLLRVLGRWCWTAWWMKSGILTGKEGGGRAWLFLSFLCLIPFYSPMLYVLLVFHGRYIPVMFSVSVFYKLSLSVIWFSESIKLTLIFFF